MQGYNQFPDYHAYGVVRNRKVTIQRMLSQYNGCSLLTFWALQFTHACHQWPLPNGESSMHTPKIIYIMNANAYLFLDRYVFGRNHIPQELPLVPYPLPHGRQPFSRVAIPQSFFLDAAVLCPAVLVPSLYPLRCEHINLKLRQNDIRI